MVPASSGRFRVGSAFYIHQFIFGKQSLSLFRGNTAFQQNRRCNFFQFLLRHGQNWTVLDFFFQKSELLLTIPFGLNEIYAV